MATNYARLHDKQFDKVVLENEELKKIVKQLKSELKDKDEETEKKIAEKDKFIELLMVDNQRLKNQINTNSTNSSKSSSTDDINRNLEKKKIPNTREKTDRLPGGQPGHKPNFLGTQKVQEMIDSGLVKYRVVNVTAEEYTVKYKIDVALETIVTEYCVVDGNGNKIDVKVPGNPIIYGNELKAISCLLSSHANVSTDKIVSFVNDLTGGVINLSKGTIINWLDKLDTNLEPERVNIKQQLLNSPIIHADITVINVNGKKCYVHNISTETHTMQLVHDSKSQATMIEGGIINYFTGIIIHDHDVSYYKFGSYHGECNIHVVRYINGVIDFTGHEWAKLLKDLFYEMKSRKEELINHDKNSMEADEIEVFKNRYRKILTDGKAEKLKDVNTNAYESEERKLLNRLTEYEDEHLLFIENFAIPFTNNRAESDLRQVKSKQNTGIFRRVKGADTYIGIISCLSTYRKQGINVFLAIKSALEGNPIIA